MTRPTFPEPLNSVINDFIPLFRQMFKDRYAIAVAGSVGKKKSDGLSDIDLRTYYDAWIDDEDLRKSLQQEANEKIHSWAERGVKIDGYWPRPISEIDSKLEAVLSGRNTDPEPCEWTIWGYYLPTDIANNTIIEDPYSVISNWQERLSTYPPVLKKAVLKKHLSSALYWRDDYHYENKVERKDVLFCSGLANLLVHNMVQIIFALNEAYYSGDGWNLEYIKHFSIVPEGFIDEMPTLLLVNNPDGYKEQRVKLCQWIDQIEQLVLGHYGRI